MRIESDTVGWVIRPVKIGYRPRNDLNYDEWDVNPYSDVEIRTISRSYAKINSDEKVTGLKADNWVLAAKDKDLIFRFG